MVRTIALANQKGGVGKTTTAVNLSAALVQRGRRVLVVDSDPQSNATLGLGVDPYAEQVTTYDVLLNPRQGAQRAVQQTASGVDLIPATIHMAAAELELAGRVGRETILREALAPLRAQYDFIFIDSPPSLSLFTLNALSAADEVIVPLQVHIYALKGFEQLQQVIALVQEKINPQLRIGGVLCTMVDKRNRLSGAIEEEIRGVEGLHVFRATIPQNIRLTEAPGAGQPIGLYDPPGSAGAKAYAALAEEVDHAN